MKKGAFTLAEILITITIIGVVAALTIPTLVTNITQRQYDTAATAFESKLGEALKIMNVQGTLADLSDTQTFVEELSRHMKITKTCHSNELEKCMPKEATWNILDLDNGGSKTSIIPLSTYTTSRQLGGEDYGTEVMGLQFANGVSALVAYNPQASQDPYSNQIVNITGSITKNNGHVSLGTDAISMIYDVNGNGKPNTAMKDLRGINSKFNKTALFKLDNIYWGEGFVPTPMTYNHCLQVKDKLGIKECYLDITTKAPQNDDYWAAAVEKCGGVNKLPTMKNLAKLADYVYDLELGTIDEKDDVFSSTAPSTGITPTKIIPNLNLNTPKAFNLIKVPIPGYFYVWADEGSASTARRRAFYSYFSYSIGSYDAAGNLRSESTFIGICVNK